MYTLFYAAGACSLFPHITLREAGLPFTLDRVDFAGGRALSSGTGDLASVNPKNYVPALRLPTGELLTEAAIVGQYLADQAPEARLAPPAGTFERVRFNEVLHFIATELHKGSGPLFSPVANEEFKAFTRARLATRLAHLESVLGDKPFLFGAFTIADAYALYALRVCLRFGVEVSPPLVAYKARIDARPAVAAALAAEGLTA